MTDFPLASLRHFLLPSQVLQVKLFQAGSIEELEQQANEWVKRTKNVIVMIGSPSKLDQQLSVGITFVPAVEQ